MAQIEDLVERFLKAPGNVYYLEHEFVTTELRIEFDKFSKQEKIFFGKGEGYIYDDSKSKLVAEQFEEGDFIFLRVKEQMYFLTVERIIDVEDEEGELDPDKLLEILESLTTSLETKIYRKNIFFGNISEVQNPIDKSRNIELIKVLLEGALQKKIKPETTFFKKQKVENPFFYHFTSIDNFYEICKTKGITAKNETSNQKEDYSNQSIQKVRSEMEVTRNPSTKVHDYVPFYFTKQSPMFFERVMNKVIDQKDTIFLAVNFEKLKENDVYYTDIAANSEKEPKPNFYFTLDNLEKLNWEKINCELTAVYGKNISKDEKKLIKRQRMAEVLVYNFVPFDWIEKIIVFDEETRLKVEEYISNSEFRPKVECDRSYFITKERRGINPNYHGYLNSSPNYLQESLITGPRELLNKYHYYINKIVSSHSNSVPKNARFKDIGELVESIDRDFSVLPELEGIEGLKTSNSTHSKTVSEHTKDVVKNVRDSSAFARYSEKEKNVLCLSAYLHDIGKGPKNKWYNGVQREWPDHPAEALPMVERILSNEVENIEPWEVERIVLLVAYHNLLGDIVKGADELFKYNGRSIDELRKLNLFCWDDLDYLKTLSEADIEAINHEWLKRFTTYVDDIKEKSNK